MAPSWPAQMAYTLQRNFRLKFRDAGHTFQEIVLPIYIIVLLVVVKLMEPELDVPATPMAARTDAFCVPVDAGVESVCALMPDRPAGEIVLAYVPQKNSALNTMVLQAVQEFVRLYQTPALSPRGFDTEEEMLAYYYAHPGTVFAAAVFEDRGIFESETLPADLHYSIRMNGSYVPSTTKRIGNKEDCVWDGYVCDANSYLNSGFLALQSVISQVVRATALPETACLDQKTKPTFVQQQALPEYHKSFASVEFQLFTALYMVLALSPVLQTTLSHIVQERETLVKDCMLMMGLRESVYWVAWLVTYAGMTGATTLILVFATKWTSLFVYTDMGTLFLIIYPFTLSLITMAFAFSTIFSKAQSATAFSGFWIFCSSLVIIPIDLLEWSTPICVLLSLNSPVGLALAVDVIVRAEGRGHGIGLRNFWSTDGGTSPLSVGALVCIFIGDALVYGIIAWYLDNVWPHPERGSKRPWNFCFSTHYWFPSRAEPSYMLAPQDNNPAFISQYQLDEASFVVGTATDVAVEVEQGAAVQDDPNVEPVPPEVAAKVAVVCKDLRKQYLGRKYWWQFWDIGVRGQGHEAPWRPDSEVIKGLNFNLYEGQLFAFVGHSKSGKSALLSILAGLSQGTSGEAYIYGLPVSDGGSELRSMVGFCPRGDICLDLLTVREQLIYFGRIKGTASHMGFESFEPSKRPPSKPLPERVEELLEDLQLVSKGDVMALELNASAKRKLSLAIALIGDPQVVFMDQPTTNMDKEAKKVFWDALRKHQEGRVFVFTTDSMEEADGVADRKAVLSHGVIKCCGSSLFLQTRFGLSYLLHVTREESFNAAAVLALLQRHIPEVTSIPTSRGHSHSTYKIPLGFPSETSALISELTVSADQLGVGEGALEATTLEEIFMQFQDEDEEEAGALPGQDSRVPDNWVDESEDLEGETLLVSNDSHVMDESSKLKKPRLKAQVLALMRSRFALYRRNAIAVLITFGLPVLITLGVLLIQSVIGSYDTKGLPLVNPEFGQSVPIYYSVGNDSISSEVIQTLLEDLGPNHKLLNQSSFATAFGVGGVKGVEGGHDSIGVSFDRLDLPSCAVEYNVLYQPARLHELPTIVSMLDNSFLKSLRKNYSADGNAQNPASLEVASHPLPFAQLASAADSLVVMLVTLGLLFIPPVLGAQVLVDKELGLMSLFRVSGMRGLAYWIATAVSDLILFYVAAFLVLAIGAGFGHIPFYKEANLAIFLLFLTTIPALALCGYVASFFFLTAQGAAPILFMYFVLAALVPFFWILAAPGAIPYGWHSFLNVVNPPYSLISGLYFVVNSIVEIKDVNTEVQGSHPRLYSFEWSTHILVSIGGAAIAIVPLALFIWMLDQHETDPEPKILEMPVERSEGDGNGNGRGDAFHDDADSLNDLKQEKERVQSNAARWESMGLMGGDGPEGDLVLCCGMGKNYGGTTGLCRGWGAEPGYWALRNLWLAVGRGEVVALVGGQKSGKSSLLHTLAGTIPLSFGDAFINGESVRYGYHNHQRLIGLCPQSDGVYSSLTVREHLELFAVLKGVPEPRGLAVEATLQALNLSAVANEVLGKCALGTRRRLSIGIAMVGGSSVLLLDEPSSGTDIATRRRVWKHLAAQSGQRASLICTQSFDEAEAIGVRVGILVSGQLKCIASPQELKRRYGSSYSLSVTTSPENLPAIRSFVSNLFPNANAQSVVSSDGQANGAPIGPEEEIREPNGQYKLQVPVKSLSGVATLLHELEEKRHSLGIVDYVVSQPTLRHVFHRLTLGDAGETITS